jgi:hypothetical protein
MMSLKDIHRAALFEAFSAVSAHVIKHGTIATITDADRGRYADGDSTDEEEKLRLLGRRDFMDCSI